MSLNDFIKTNFITIFLVLFVVLVLLGLLIRKIQKTKVTFSIFILCLLFAFYFYKFRCSIDLIKSLFYSFGIFFGFTVEEVAEEYEFEQWILVFCSSISLIAILFKQVQVFLDVLVSIFRNFSSKFYVVHGDKDRLNRIMEIYNIKNKKKFAICSRETESFYRFAKRHVLLYENDSDNLAACEDLIKNPKKEKYVYLSTTKIDPSQYRNTIDSKIYPFNMEDTVARQFCIDHVSDIFPQGSENRFKRKIAIVGSNDLFYKLFPQMIKNFVFDVCSCENGKPVNTSEQSIQYYLFNDSELTKSIVSRLKTWDKSNGKRIDNKCSTMDTIEILSSEELYRRLGEMDIVITTDEDNSINENVSLMLYSQQKAFIYNKSYTLGKEYNNSNNIFYFGSEEIILSLDKIINDEVMDQAKQINQIWSWYSSLDKNKKSEILSDKLVEIYTSKKGLKTINDILEKNKKDIEWNIDKNWNECSTYNKHSSIASAVHSIVLRKVFGENYYLEAESAKQENIEHARWVRFMEMEGWSFYDGKPEIENGEKKRKYNDTKQHFDIQYNIDTKEKMKDVLVNYIRSVAFENNKK